MHSHSFFSHTQLFKLAPGTSLASYAEQALYTASGLASTVRLLNSENASSGMLLSMDSKRKEIFSISPSGSKENSELLAFLDGVTRNWLQSVLIPFPKSRLRAPSQESIEKIRAKGKTEFEKLMEEGMTLFSENENIISSIVIISDGIELPQTEQSYDDAIKILEDLGSITLSAHSNVNLPNYFQNSANYAQNSNGYWAGVDLFALQGNHGLGTRDGISYNGMTFPYGASATFQAEVRNANKGYAVDLITATDGQKLLSFAGHSLSSWDPELTWSAFDPDNGSLMGSYVQELSSSIGSADSNRAKLFAAHSSARSEVYENSSLPPVYGVVGWGYSLLALEEDVVSAEDQINLKEAGVPHLRDSEIFFPVVNSATDPGTDPNGTPSSIAKDQTNVILHIEVLALGFRIEYSSKYPILEARVVDMRGHVIELWNHLDSGQGEIFWNGRDRSGNQVAQGIYFLQLRTRLGVQSRTLHILY